MHYITVYREYSRKIMDLYELFLNCNECQLRGTEKYITTCMMKRSQLHLLQVQKYMNCTAK